MRLNLNLAQKGIVLVSVPLIFELVFAASLYILEQRAEMVAAEEQHSKAIVSQVNQVLKTAYDTITTGVLFGVTKSELLSQRYHKLALEAPLELNKLKELVAGDPKLMTEYDILEAKFRAGFGILHNVIAATERGQTTGIWQGVQLKAQVKITSNAFMEQATHIVELENRHRMSMPLSEAKARQLFNACLLSGIVANIIISMLLAVFFTKDIRNRLEILVGNTMLLKEGEGLKPVLPGNDEIAQLDHVFHDMARTLSNAKQADKEAFERVRSMIQSMPIGLLAIDKQGTICAVNPRIEEMFGYVEAELIGSNIRRLFPANQTNGEEALTSNLLLNPMAQIPVVEASKKSGLMFPAEISLTEYTTIDGARLLATIIDITERQRMEQLRKEFVAMVSHDLKSPLTSVNTSLALIAQGTYGSLTEKGLRVASDAEHETVRLITLIGDLLDLARMDAGRLEVHCAPVNLDHVFEQSLRAVASLAEQKKVSIDLGSAGATVSGDSDRLVQVMVNLLSNALRYSPEGSKITVCTERSNGYAEIRVIDHGPGIPQTLRETIFERFEQIDVLNPSARGAAGLGLSICKAIIEAHTGSIGVSSQEGQGSTFWFRVPLIDQAKLS
jgi:PAS domain S-box-containing protein